MKRKTIAIMLILVMVMSVACNKGGKDNRVTEPENTQNQAGNQNVDETKNETVNNVTDNGAKKNSSDIYDADGNIYVEYTEDYYYKHAYRGDVFEYDLEKYAKICPFVGRWYIPGDNVWETSGYYFFSDGFVSRVYGNGTISPIAAVCYMNDDGELVAEDLDARFYIVNGMLACTENDNLYPYSLIEFPNDDFPVDFCGYWTKDPAGEELTAEYLELSFFEPNYVWHMRNGSIQGKAVMWSPITMAFLGDDGNPVKFVTMDGVQTMSSDEEFWYQLNDNGDSDDTSLEEAEIEFFEPFFNENAYYSVDSEFDLGAVKSIYDYVGAWLITNNDSIYRYDENFAMSGFDIYADGVWTAINQNGIQSCSVGQVAVIDDATAITLIDSDGMIVSILNLRDDGTLLNADGEIFARVFGTHDFTYPRKGTPTECLGYWGNPDGEGNLGVFFIDRDGAVLFPNDDHNISLAWTIDAEHIMISIEGGEDVILSTYEVNSGRLIDENGVVYEQAG